MLFPITFSIPKEKLYKDNIIFKEKILSNLIPGDTKTYIYNSEEDYYNEYKKSYFAITTKKGGWDCLRHYEILANGCIPYFFDIENCPNYTLYLCPKNLFLEANNLYDTRFKNKNFSDITEEDNYEYHILLNKLFEYIKQNLTTEKIAKYILEKSNFTNVNKILFLSQNIEPDYLRCLTLHGFKELFGSNCHDYPKIPHLYKSDKINYKNLYGKGITYTNLLNENLHNDLLDNNIENNIINKYYDIIIYGSYHRGMPFYELVNKIYKPNEIILLCGEDIHYCDCYNYINNGHYVFVREL